MSGRHKTNTAAKKRFKITGKGKIKHKKAGKRHNLLKKSESRKRRLSIYGLLSPGDAKKAKRSLGI